MYRYTWVAIDRDGRLTQRWNDDGTENVPPPYPREFHLLPSPEGVARGLRPFSLFLRPEQRLIYRKRRHLDSVGGGPLVEDRESIIHIVGFEEDAHCAYFACYAFLLPDGRIEWAHDLNHVTIYERNLDTDPPRFYETF